jgi:tRNA G10  N-methylase Trm11
LRYYFITKKENLELARDECIALIKAYDADAKILMKNRLVIVESDTDLRRVGERASMLRYAAKDIDNIDNIKSFRCKVINLLDIKVDYNKYIDKFMHEIKKSLNAKVSLRDSDTTFGIIIDEEVYYCMLLDRREIKLRKIYKHPAELNDRLAILMINLSGVKEDEMLLDPCCGTGTIVMYASNIGINAIGCDIAMKMCRYSKINLDANNLYASIINCDSIYLPIERVDVMVSNMPYGRASSTYKRNSRKLINAIINECNARKVIMCKKGDEPEHIKAYDLYVHSNLSRRIVICR